MSKDSTRRYGALMPLRLIDDIIDLILVYIIRVLMSIPLAIGAGIEEMKELWG